ncbi:hypothetical protein CI109_100065 [Kwoniella shandongensis]|uniref:Uncharacterized protein n=1 Tax=Kwoniella shandongensis TaxID=1734106 RepID=A0A5M6BRX1_9TREE|nr:uncharacterized protein CI109_005962 [Kwoniella shandongensis]KAA5525654.1 hypothetical protein CI109_005962 [Kwoniella shandongensis]
MRPTAILSGASRLSLTPKRGNKDFYKGTGQSRVPGGGHRTGPPGVHVVKGKAKYRILDDKVRVFVGPGAKVLEETELRPYVATRDESVKDHSIFYNPFSRTSSSRPRIPSFSPNLQPTATATAEQSRQLTNQDFARFSKRYQSLSGEQKQALIMDSRRKWWEGMSQIHGGGAGLTPTSAVEEEGRTKELENRAAEETTTQEQPRA